MTKLINQPPQSGLGEVLHLSWPASLSMLNSTIMRFVDGLMVSFIGTIPFSAQLVGGLAAFVPESFATGMLAVVNTYVAQNLGAKLYNRCGQYAWAGVFLASLFCLLITPLIFFAEPIFYFLTKDQPQTPDVIELRNLEIMYFRYMVAAVFVTLTARPLEQFFYGVHRPRIVLFASITANLVNVVLGYILIFGSSGLPALEKYLHLDLQNTWLGQLNIPKYGLEGGAWGNLISWGLYMVILLVIFLSHKMAKKFGTRQLRSVKLRECLELARIGWPAGMQFITDVLPWTLMLAWLVGKFGPAELAATSAAMRWMPLSFMPAVGIGIATTALVGKYLGKGQPDIARKRTYTALGVALVYMGFCGLIFFFFREQLVAVLITVTPGDLPQYAAAEATRNDIIRIGGYVMICAAIFQLFDAMGIVFTGALRGAGDTFVPMLITLVTSWGLTVGGGWLMTELFPQLGSIGPWIGGSAYVIVISLILFWRFRSGAWRRIDLLHRGTVESAESTLLPPMIPPSPPSPPSWMQSHDDEKED